MSETAPPRFGVVLPAKRLAVAKSRMAALGDEVRRELVAAFVLDTLSTSLDCVAVGAVLLVTDDIELATAARDLGAWAIPDGRPGDLNATLVQGAHELHRRDPALRPVALCGDLPALRADDLGLVLTQAAEHRSAIVADRAGDGTTLYTAESPELFAPRFGPGSRAAHLAGGATELTSPPGVRQDVDDPDDLAAALELGVGSRTSLVVTLRGLDRRGSEGRGHTEGAAP